MTATDQSPQVHIIETSVGSTLPTDYREYRRRHCLSEWNAVRELYSALDDKEGAQRASRLEACRAFAYFARNSDTGKVRVISSACRLRWCPVCAGAKSMHIISQVDEWLEKVHRPKFLTLTMKHTNAPLEHQIKWLYKHFRAFRIRKEIRRKIHGGIWFFQLKRSKDSQQWHPHLHTVIDSDYIPKELISELWQKQTGSSFVIDIRAIRSKTEVAKYVSRYCAKPAKLTDYSNTDRILIHTVFHGKRLCGTWGNGNRIKLIRQRSEDRNKWSKIGMWYAVTAQSNVLQRAQAIIQAWQNDTELPAGITVDYSTIKSPYDLNSESYPRLGIEDIKGNFDQFL